MKTVAVLIVIIILSSQAAGGMTEENDLLEKGPYELRAFPRIIGPDLVPEKEIRTLINHHQYILSDSETGDTNQIIISLDYNQSQRIKELLLNSGVNQTVNTRPAIERQFVQALQEKAPALSKAMGFPTQVKFVFDNDRMSDDSRIQAEKNQLIQEKLERYILLTYQSIDAARAALVQLKDEKSISNVGLNKSNMTLSYSPNDPYFSPPAISDPRKYQWGLHAMNFPAAWDIVKGNAYIGILDFGYFGTMGGVYPKGVVNLHPDLINKYRGHLSPGYPFNPYASFSVTNSPHSTHVAGIIGAQANNGIGVSGGCLNCSIENFPIANSSFLGIDSNQSTARSAVSIKAAIEAGVQVLNWSGDSQQATCSSIQILCDLFDLAQERGMLVVESVGNFNSQTLTEPMVSLSRFPVLPVGGTAISNPQIGVPNSRWEINNADGPLYPAGHGSAWPGIGGVLAPATSAVSTFIAGRAYNPGYFALCSDSSVLSTTGPNFPVAVPSDESGNRFSNGYGDGYASCTGTSMSAPHVTALAGMILSINPLLSTDQVRQIIRQSGNLSATPTSQLGSGLPNALVAVNSALATNTRRLTPFFSFYSATRSDSFYTTVPQMANAALDGTLFPRKPMPAIVNSYVALGGGIVNDWSDDVYTSNGQLLGTYVSSYGIGITNYSSFPRSPFVIGGTGSSTPLAEVWVFTTDANPKSATVALSPIIRMSWKCADGSTLGIPAVCSSNPAHIDTVYVNSSEEMYFKSIGYKTDGTEGYVYPKSLPQPTGTVKLMRKYSPARDDHAIFPDTSLTTMSTQGYTATTNTSNWLGYVYRNINGAMPIIQ